MNIVKIISTKVEAGKRLVKFLRLGLDDVQENHVSSPHGIDSNPVKDMTAVYAQTSVKGESVIIGYINSNALAEIGELRLFSTDSDGGLEAEIRLRNNGDIEINGDADNMVRFSDLETGFNALRSDLNTLISTYNSHIHPFVGVAVGAPASTTPTTSTGTPSTSSIEDSKIDNVLTN